MNLKKLPGMIEDEEWSAMDVDVKGPAFDELLEKAAGEGKKGEGQYFTPRRLIELSDTWLWKDTREVRQGIARPFALAKIEHRPVMARRA